MSEIISFGEWVQKRRNIFKYSRTVLAQKVGCSPITIKKIERDERRPSIQIAELLATHLHIPTDKREDFISRARGEFVPHFGSPIEMSFDETQEEAAPKHNLPLQTTPFFGREQEVADIISKLNDPSCRLLTIMGAGGMGKTRLAIQIGEQLIDEYTDGITYVSLAPVSQSKSSIEVDPVAAALADVLNTSFKGKDGLEQQIIRYLHRKEMLLIFDNFEHLLESAPFIGDLISQSPDIKMLITSRERLDLQEEWLYPLKGLSTQPESSATQLFEQKAKQLDPTFDLAGQLQAVLGICQLVEGMPLAVELAATWIRQLSCEEIESQIKSSFDFLTTGSRNVPERHRSVRVLFDYSWGQMTIQERMVLQRLSVFRGGFEHSAAKSVANAPLPLLMGLVDKSLLSIDKNRRYQIHELLRQFAAEKLVESSIEEEKCTKLHCQYFLGLLASQEPVLKGADGVKAMRVIEQDIENIRQAIKWGVHHQLHLFNRQVGTSLEIFLSEKGWPLEGVMLFTLIADNLKLHCEQHELDKPKVSKQADCILWAQYQCNVGMFELDLGQPHDAVESHLSCLSALPNEDPAAHWTRSWCLLNIGDAIGFIDGSPYDEYFKACGKTIHLADDPWLRGRYLVDHGQRCTEMGLFEKAQLLLDQGFSIFEKLESQIQITKAKQNLARLAYSKGQLKLAEKLCQQNLQARREISQTGVSWSLANLGKIYRLQGNIQLASEYSRQALLLSQEINLQYAQAISFLNFGHIALSVEDFAAADHYFQLSKRIMPLSEFAGGEGFAAIGLGEIERAKRIFYYMLKTTIASDIKKASLEAIVGFAYLEAEAKQFNRVIELLAFVRNHPSLLFETKLYVDKLKEKSVDYLSTDQFVEAKKRGQALELNEAAKILLADFQPQ